MKKCVSILLTGLFLTVLLSTGAFTVSAGLENKVFEEYTYNVIDEEVVIIDVQTTISGNVVIPESIQGYPVTGIAENSFDGCNRIVTLKIPSKVSIIDEASFEECTDLREFTVAPTNKNYCARKGVLFNKDRTTLVCYPAGKTDTTYAVPDGVTRIDPAAFGWTAALESVTIADGMKTLCDKAFYTCTALKQVVFGTGLTEIGVEAFAGCRALEVVTIPNSVTTLGRGAFSNCSNLAKVTFGRGLTSISGAAFLNCVTLKSVAIPDNVTSIVSSAFSGCTGLETITIPKNVSNIGSYAFYKCVNLKTVRYTGSQTEKTDSLTIGARNEVLDEALWQYRAPSVKPPAKDTPVGRQSDGAVDWWWVIIGSIVVLLTAAIVVIIVLLVKGIKIRQ